MLLFCFCFFCFPNVFNQMWETCVHKSSQNFRLTWNVQITLNLDTDTVHNTVFKRDHAHVKTIGELSSTGFPSRKPLCFDKCCDPEHSCGRRRAAGVHAVAWVRDLQTQKAESLQEGKINLPLIVMDFVVWIFQGQWAQPKTNTFLKGASYVWRERRFFSVFSAKCSSSTGVSAAEALRMIYIFF